jgi:hypothetical protein
MPAEERAPDVQENVTELPEALVPPKSNSWDNWATQSIIRKLYVEERMPLGDVRRIMEEEYGFLARYDIYLQKQQHADRADTLQ